MGGAAGRLDVLVNDAGFALAGAVDEFSDEEVQAAFDIAQHRSLSESTTQ